jgi:hypothetical protein
VFETRDDDSESSATFCSELCNLLKQTGGKPCFMSGNDVVANYGISFSELADVAPLVVMRLLNHVSLHHTHVVLFVSVFNSVAWAREVCCAASTVLLIAKSCQEKKEEKKEDDQRDNFAVLSVIPSSSQFISREIVAVKQVRMNE